MNKLSGRNFINMMKPILGIEGVKGITSLKITANVLDMVRMEIQAIPDINLNGVSCENIDAATETVKYIVTVERLRNE